MLRAAADLRIDARFIAPMTERNEVLENHSLLIRDGRILDILPRAAADGCRATALLKRPTHVLLPGMVNAHADAAALLLRASPAAPCPPARTFSEAAEFTRDGVMAAIADMLKSGITCFCDDGYFPDETARVAVQQGMRVVVGMPLTEGATPWARDAAQALTRALDLRDRYAGDALVTTVFAPRALNSLSDAALARLVTLADELDAGIALPLHRSRGEIAGCIAAHGVRPMVRLRDLGLLTPALVATHMTHLSAADLELAQRTGIAATLCPQSGLKCGEGLPPIALLAAGGMRLSLGSAGRDTRSHELWGDLKLLALAGAGALNAWEALRIATHGGAAVLGLDAQIGTLQAGRWADLCCADLSGPAMQPAADTLEQLVFCGGRDVVSDVWVAGRHLLSGGELTRLDWSGVAARCAAWAVRMSAGG